MIQEQSNNGESNVIRGNLQNFSTNKITSFQVVIMDGLAVSTFQDSTLAKKLVKAGKKQGNENIRYDEKINSAIEKYPGKDIKEITKIITKELNNSGAQISK